MRMKIIKLFNKKYLKIFLKYIYITLYSCRFKIGKYNNVSISNTVFYKSKICIKGKGNTIELNENAFYENCNIVVKGNNNKISIGKNTYTNMLHIIIEGDNNSIVIGDNFFVCGNTRLYVVDGSTLIMGKECMLADNIEIRTTDNHGIYDLESGNRINLEEDIHIGNHVWIGMGATILKGTIIADGCIIGAKSVIAKEISTQHCCVVGNGRIVRENITWKMERSAFL